MNKEIPVCNRLCFYHDIKRAWDIHESKISSQGPVIDCHEPSTLTITKKSNQNQTLRGFSTNRKDEIERDNNFLLKKLLNINGNQGVKKKKTKNKQRLPNLAEINRIQREEKLRKIEKQNQVMNNRLSYNTAKASEYSLKQLNSQREKTENLISLISRFPSKNNQQNKSSVKFEMKNSPGKYNNRFMTYKNAECRTAEIVSVLNGIRYKIFGQYKPEGIEIVIRNPVAAVDKHTLKIDEKQSSEIYKIFCQSLKTVLQSVSYDSKNRHFFLRLPNTNSESSSREF